MGTNPEIKRDDIIDYKTDTSLSSNFISDNLQAFTYKIFNVPDSGFGYDIYQNGKLLIHQPNIPGRPGNRGFSKKSDAQNVAKLVIEKLKKGSMPPTVTDKELRRLGI